jgi:hypothetical protein
MYKYRTLQIGPELKIVGLSWWQSCGYLRHRWTNSELEAGTMTLEFSMMRSKSSKCRNMSKDIVMTTEYAFSSITAE